MEQFKFCIDDEIKKVSKEETENEKPNQILETVNEILDFNKENQKQRGSGMKMLTPYQMLSRLLIYFSSIKSRK